MTTVLRVVRLYCVYYLFIRVWAPHAVNQATLTHRMTAVAATKLNSPNIVDYCSVAGPQ